MGCIVNLISQRAAVLVIQCAWVLWEATGTGVSGGRFGTGVSTGGWSVLNAWPSYTDCLRGRDKTIATRVDATPGLQREGEDILVSRSNHEGVTVITATQYLCLPDTVDPRTPRGK
jgi:hypothetical protein